jgi:acetyl esterase/lipase
MSRPLVADTLARLVTAFVNPTPKPSVRFIEIAGRIDEVTIPTRHGPADATIYRPEATGTKPAVYVNIHGGGFVGGYREMDDPWCRFLAAHADVVVVNTDYVLAPRKRFPAPVEQLHDVLQWASAPQRDWDGGRLCVGGQSAGGNLSAAVARMALTDGGPAIALQVLHYPVLDLVTPTAEKKSTLGAKCVVKPWMDHVFNVAYVPERARRRDALVSPALDENADDIAGIAPALVVTAEYDRLCGEARRYADTLAAAGSLAEYYEVPSVDHGYNIMTDARDVTRQVYGRIAGHVHRAIGET